MVSELGSGQFIKGVLEEDEVEVMKVC